MLRFTVTTTTDLLSEQATTYISQMNVMKVVIVFVSSLKAIILGTSILKINWRMSYFVELQVETSSEFKSIRYSKSSGEMIFYETIYLL